MGKNGDDIKVRFGKRLGLFKKKANISYAKIHYATTISENHVKNTVKGKVNIGLIHIELYAKLFGVNDHEMLNYESPIPKREVLQKNISEYFKSIGFKSLDNFKKLGPSYVIEEFFLELNDFMLPLEAAEIKDLINQSQGSNYKTNDVSRVLNSLSSEDIVLKVTTGNSKKPKYVKNRDESN